jgi:hypothetical protein
MKIECKLDINKFASFLFPLFLLHRVCHRFRQINRDDYFELLSTTFEVTIIFLVAAMAGVKQPTNHHNQVQLNQSFETLCKLLFGSKLINRLQRRKNYTHKKDFF